MRTIVIILMLVFLLSLFALRWGMGLSWLWSIGWAGFMVICTILMFIFLLYRNDVGPG